jgi:hypothetical protein
MLTPKILAFKKINKILSFVLLICILFLSPFYFFSSGLIQPAHIIIFIACLAIIYINNSSFFELLKANKIGLYFLASIIVINFIYAALYRDKSFIVNTLYWIYGFILMFAILSNDWSKSFKKWISRLIGLKLVLIVLAYLFGLGGYEFWPRYDYYFNSPNQLAYFAICLFLINFSIGGRKYDYVDFIVYSVSIFIIIASGGRSAYLAIFPIVMLLLVFNWRRPLILMILIATPAALIFLFNHFCFPLYKYENLKNVRYNCGASQSVYQNTQQRLNSLTLNPEIVDNSSIKIQLQARGYERIIQFPEYLLFGAGQGKEDRFGDFKGNFYEIHSSLFAIWFYYGIAGLVLFLIFIYNLIPVKINLLVLSPLFVYGLFTFGLRSPYVWMVFGFLALAPNLFNGSNDKQVQ